jgi:TRAP transporter TAXI family solute receptor
MRTNMLGEEGMRIRCLAAALIIAAIWPAPSWSAPPGWPASLTIGTASPGGFYPIYGEALAQILTEALGLPVMAQATQGSAQNILLLERGSLQLGLVIAGIAFEGWNGTGAWTHDQKLRSMRALVPMYDAPITMVALKSSGIRSLTDMAGKRVAPGPPSSAGGIYAKKFFDLLDIQATWRYGAFETLSTDMQSGLVDALISTIAPPAPILTKLDQTGEIRFVPMSADEITKLCTAMPELSPSVVPAGTYPSMTTDYTTVGFFNFVVASKDLPDDLVYAIVKAFYANYDGLVKAVPAARESVAENAKSIPVIPFHPGALRYYRELGVEIPAGLVPAN